MPIQSIETTSNNIEANPSTPTTDHNVSSPTKKKKKEGRDWKQVLATGAIPSLICLLPSFLYTFPSLSHYSFSKYLFSSHISTILYNSYMSTNMADTLSSEIGMISTIDPLLITDWRGRIAPGNDGGVSLLGTSAGIMGSILMAIIHILTNYNILNYQGMIHTLLFFIQYGVIGSVLDSILGVYLQTQPALLQNSPLKNWRYYSRSNINMNYQQWLLSNSIVNLLSALFTSLFALFIDYIEMRTSYTFTPLILLFLTLLFLHLLSTVYSALNPILLDTLTILIMVIWSIIIYGQMINILIAFAVVFYIYALDPLIRGNRIDIQKQK